MRLQEKASRIRLIVLDVDGVLTDGQISIGLQGELCKHFNVKDGLGIKMLMEAGITVTIITGRRSSIVAARMRELGVGDVIQGCSDKRQAFMELIRARQIQPEECACMGDDIPDLPVLTAVGLSAAPADASDEVLRRVDYVANRAGGAGAVREFAEFILKAQGQWEKLLARRGVPPFNRGEGGA